MGIFLYYFVYFYLDQIVYFYFSIITGYGYRNFFSLKARVLIVFNLGYSNTDRNVKKLIDYDNLAA